jgi:hypothetical protein
VWLLDANKKSQERVARGLIKKEMVHIHRYISKGKVNLNLYQLFLNHNC